MTTIKWEKYPLIEQCIHSRSWLKGQADLKLAQNTIDAYGRALEDFFSVCAQLVVPAESAKREHVAAYVQQLSQRQKVRLIQGQAPVGLANATLQQRLTAVRDGTLGSREMYQ